LAKLIAKSNFHALDINFLAAVDEKEEKVTPHVKEVFSNSPWYTDLIFVLHILQYPPSLTNTKDRFLKLKALKHCILDGNLYCKDVGGIFLNFFIKG
jgi:hypothetical protein